MVVYYPETSALVKRYQTEKGSDVLEELFNGKGLSDAFVTSLFTVLEVSATANRLFRGGTLGEPQCRALMSRFLMDVRGIVVLPVDNELMFQSISVAQGHYLKAGDAVHIASALHVGSLIQGNDEVVAVASDREVCAACHSLGLKVLDSETDDARQKLEELRQ